MVNGSLPFDGSYTKRVLLKRMSLQIFDFASSVSLGGHIVQLWRYVAGVVMWTSVPLCVTVRVHHSVVAYDSSYEKPRVKLLVLRPVCMGFG